MELLNPSQENVENGGLCFPLSHFSFFLWAKKSGTINWHNQLLWLSIIFGSLPGVYHSHVANMKEEAFLF